MTPQTLLIDELTMASPAERERLLNNLSAAYLRGLVPGLLAAQDEAAQRVQYSNPDDERHH